MIAQLVIILAGYALVRAALSTPRGCNQNPSLPAHANGSRPCYRATPARQPTIAKPRAKKAATSKTGYAAPFAPATGIKQLRPAADSSCIESAEEGRAANVHAMEAADREGRQPPYIDAGYGNGGERFCRSRSRGHGCYAAPAAAGRLPQTQRDLDPSPSSEQSSLHFPWRRLQRPPTPKNPLRVPRLRARRLGLGSGNAGSRGVHFGLGWPQPLAPAPEQGRCQIAAGQVKPQANVVGAHIRNARSAALGSRHSARAQCVLSPWSSALTAA